MKTILLTNDDGIEADGLLRLAKATRRFGKVYIVAPAHQRSAASHSISLHSPVDVFPYAYPLEGVTAFASSGMPGDCVRVGSLAVLDQKPDIVLSGINNGYNVASDIQYSATAGAAFEASFQGLTAVALSEGFDHHEVTDAMLDTILEKVFDAKPVEGQIINVNFPECPLAEFRGIREGTIVSRSMVFRDTYDMIEELENGKRYMVHGTHCYDAEEGTDYRALLDGYISIGVVNNVGYPVVPYETVFSTRNT
ncbi:MAG: 5'/3'-nucleotidase SurE [Lachnospiraceae bacterium]|nr:5'/3'-nucleotidase SurE [Lachnospiraceae bacterium]